MALFKSNSLFQWSSEKRLTVFLTGCAAICGTIVLLILLFLTRESLPAIQSIGIHRFLTDNAWYPSEGEFSLVSMLLGTIIATFGAVGIATPVGIFSAIFCQYYAPSFLARFYRNLIQVLAGIPSVVFGFWGLVVFAPLVAKIHPPGTSLLTGIFILSIMILPTIALTIDSSLSQVPTVWIHGAHALGMSQWSIIQKIGLPTARSGIFTSIILATGRAIGETMAILMVAGNVVQIPKSLFDPVRTLTANIALEMAYAMGNHRAALFVSGLALIGLILIIVVVADGFTKELAHE